MLSPNPLTLGVKTSTCELRGGAQFSPSHALQIAAGISKAPHKSSICVGGCCQWEVKNNRQWSCPAFCLQRVQCPPTGAQNLECPLSLPHIWLVGRKQEEPSVVKHFPVIISECSGRPCRSGHPVSDTEKWAARGHNADISRGRTPHPQIVSSLPWAPPSLQCYSSTTSRSDLYMLRIHLKYTFDKKAQIPYKPETAKGSI